MKHITESRIVIIGMGNIGRILVQRLLKVGFAKEQIYINDVDADRANDMVQQFGVEAISLEDARIGSVDMIILATPPKTVVDILRALDKNLLTNQIVISMAAAVTLNFMRKNVKNPVSLVRILPNPPSLVGKGMNPVAFEPTEKIHVKEIVHELLEILGNTLEAKDELMTWCVGLTGAALRTVFPVLDGMIRAGVEAGLSQEDSRRVAAQIFNGVSALALETELPLDQIHNLTPMQTLDESAVSELFLETARNTRQKVDAAQASIMGN